MTLEELTSYLPLERINDVPLNKEVKDICIGDLLSFIMANGQADDLWLTVQKHVNVVAVASLLEFAGIVFVYGVDPDNETIQKANQEGIPLFKSSLSTYDLLKGCYHVL